MSRELSIVEARKRLTQLPEELEQGESGAMTITRRGKPVMAVMSYALYDSLMETLEIMADLEMMPLLRQSIQEAGEGKLEEWSAFKRELKL